MNRFEFEVDLFTETIEDDSWTQSECPSEADFLSAFDRSYFSYGDAEICINEPLFSSTAADIFVDLEIDEEGSIECDSSGYELLSLSITEGGSWVARLRCKVEIQLSVLAENPGEARKLIQQLAPKVFLVRDLPVGEVIAEASE